MSTTKKRVAIKVDASVFGKRIGDPVKKGEILGNFAGSDIEAPFNGIVENVSFDSEDHTLAVVLLAISR
jgi:hypothetical protein